MNNMSKHSFNKNIQIAVDTSENSRRAVAYVAKMLGGMQGFHVTLLHVIPDPEEDYFPSEMERKSWLDGYRNRTDVLLAEYRGMLMESGFAPDAVDFHAPRRYCPSMAECILAERDTTEYHTLVVGRQGISRSEEFLFGSVSSKIVNHAKNCTVWVVE